jgi:hypothetical protein
MASSPDTMHNFIDELLKHFGTEKKSRDVFDIVVVKDMSKLEYIDEYFEEMDEDDAATIMSHYGTIFDEPYSADQRKRIIDIGLGLVKEGIITDDFFENDYEYRESSYLISLKDGAPTEIGKLVERLFSHEASYDG